MDMTSAPSPSVMPSEAIYGFATFLSRLDGTLKVGRSHSSAVLADLVDQYCKQQKYEPPRDSKSLDTLRGEG